MVSETGGISLWIVLLLLMLVFWFVSRARRWREETGLPDGRVIYTDTGTWFPNSEVMYAAELRLVGRPDYLVEQPNGAIIPVEIKASGAPIEPRLGHVLQLASYCLLVEANFGRRPGYGILQYRDKAFAIEYTSQLEEELQVVLEEMRDALPAADLARDHDDYWRCASCGVRQHCHERLA